MVGHLESCSSKLLFALKQVSSKLTYWQGF